MEKARNILIKVLVGLVVFMGRITSFPFLLFGKKIDPKSILSGKANILVIKVWAIGEVAMATPVFRELKSNFPKINLTILVGKNSADLIKNNPNIDAIIGVEEKIFLNSNLLEIYRLIARLKRKRFDIAVILHHSVFFSIFAWLIGAKVRVGYDRKGEGFLNTIRIRPVSGRHKIDECLSVINALGGKVQKRDLEIFPTTQDKEFIEDFLKRNGVSEDDISIGIMPTGGSNPASNRIGAGLERKVWPLDYYIELSKMLVENLGAKVIILGGRDELEKSDLIKSKVKNGIINGVDKMSLRQLNSFARNCDLIVTNDSGPMHVVSASDTPVLAIFGPTDPFLCGPVSKNSYIINKNLGCSPCFIGEIFPNIVKRCDYKAACMKLVKPKEVFRLIEEKLKDKKAKIKI